MDVGSAGEWVADRHCSCTWGFTPLPYDCIVIAARVEDLVDVLCLVASTDLGDLVEEIEWNRLRQDSRGWSSGSQERPGPLGKWECEVRCASGR